MGGTRETFYQCATSDQVPLAKIKKQVEQPRPETESLEKLLVSCPNQANFWRKLPVEEKKVTGEILLKAIQVKLERGETISILTRALKACGGKEDALQLKQIWQQLPPQLQTPELEEEIQLTFTKLKRLPVRL